MLRWNRASNLEDVPVSSNQVDRMGLVLVTISFEASARESSYSRRAINAVRVSDLHLSMLSCPAASCQSTKLKNLLRTQLTFALAGRTHTVFDLD
jgi:hypothetical protein